MTYIWRRQTHTTFQTNLGGWWVDARGEGATYIRSRFRWGFYGDTPNDIDLQNAASFQITMGLVCVYGDGSETPPDPRLDGDDVYPIGRRWIYWETRSVYPTAISPEQGVVTWRDTGSTEETDTKAMVSAGTPPAGQTLNLWASWSSYGDWRAAFGNSVLWIGIANLIRFV